MPDKFVDKTQNEKIRDQNVDIYRGIAILLILIGHLFWAEKIASLIYSFHLALFFFVTGFFIDSTATKYDFVNFLLNRIRNILVPYILALIVFLFLVIAVRLKEIGIVNSILELFNVFFISSSAIIESSKYQVYYWFMPLFFVYSIILYLVFRYVRKYIFVVYILSLISAFGLYLYFKFISYETQIVPWNIDKIPFILPLGILGNAVWKRREFLFQKRNMLLVFTGLVLLLGFKYKTDLRILFFNNLFFYFLLAMNGSIFVLLLSDFLDKNLSNGAYSIKKLLVFLGQNTMIVYLVHGIVYPIWHGKMGSPSGYSTVFNLTAIAMSIFLTFVFVYFREVIIYSRQNYRNFQKFN